MNAYQKQIKELYKPKASERKAAELKAVNDKLKHNVRERKAPENYLGYVREQNVLAKRNGS